MSTSLVLALSTVLLAACAPAAPPPPSTDAVLPSFTPAPELRDGAAPAGSPPSPADDAPSPTVAVGTTATDDEPPRREDETEAGDGAGRTLPTSAAEGARAGSIDDPAGDVRPGTPLQDPPASVDLRRLTLTRHTDGYEVRVRLGAAPPDRRERDRITNVATFYDVDGDGELDYQVYATSTSDGWGSAHFDHVRGTSRYADDDEVEVTVEDEELVLRFPLGHLGGAEELQWSAASQWGTFEELQTGTEARDRAPDDGHGVLWPAR